MPTYEYECASCGRRFEKFQSITADPLEECILEDCDPPGKVRRLIGTGAAILFKGSGFYETDYRSQDYQEKKKAESKGASAKSDGSGTSDSSNGGGSEAPSSSGDSGSTSRSTASSKSNDSDP